jgi:hypothetical protein
MGPVNNSTKRELIIEVWEQLDCESVGEKELAEIQRSVSDRFGAGAVDSPAAIARLLADEGAVLRHPEVIDCDAHWRARCLSESILPAAFTLDGLEEAVAAIKAFDLVRGKLEAEARVKDLIRLRHEVQSLRRDRLLVARSKAVSERARLEAGEIADWLSVWLNSPGLFDDWLDLRRRSADFIERFAQNRLR